MGRDHLRDLQRLRPPFGLLDPLVATAGARVGRRRHVDGIFAGQYAARQRAVGDDTQAIVSGGRELLDLGGAVDKVVERLAN
jgi:hypothetical protein